MTLREKIAGLIAREGPIDVARYMTLCLHDPEAGYYATRPELGETGDFITSPLVSQMFGELLGLWAAEVWLAMGRPDPVRLVEIGPGHGVMMSDILRAARAAPGFREACDVWLVETSAPLRARQAATLAPLAAPRWADGLEEVPGGAPLIILSNEYLDCLAIGQAILTAAGWRERRVGLAADGHSLAFVAGEPVAPPAGGAGASEGAVAEWSDDLAAAGAGIGARIATDGGAALFIDYGRDAVERGDTLQALRRHAKVDPLDTPGEADLTAHVDFPAFLAAAARAGVAVGPIRTQAGFLKDLGIATRAARLAAARPDRAEVIARQLDRLVGADQMGQVFKVAVIHTPGLTPPGFEATA